MGLPNIGPGELIIILIIALVVLGPGKLPDVASALGKSVREFHKAASDIQDAAKIDTPAAPPAVSAPTPTAIAAPATPQPAAPQPAAMAAPQPMASEPNQLSGAAEPNTIAPDDQQQP
jgi:sec-independent protein translocase protein TatA